jgi:hypothetical protein
MKDWGDSTVATKYVYERLHEIMDMEDDLDRDYTLSRFMDELGRAYKADTGRLIGEDL